MGVEARILRTEISRNWHQTYLVLTHTPLVGSESPLVQVV